MKTSIEYLDAAKARLGIESDYAMAKLLDITKQAMSNYRHGRNSMDVYAATRVAEILEIDPMEVIAAASAEGEKNPERRNFWQKKWAAIRASIAAAVVAVCVLAGGIPQLEPAAAGFRRKR